MLPQHTPSGHAPQYQSRLRARCKIIAHTHSLRPIFVRAKNKFWRKQNFHAPLQKTICGEKMPQTHSFLRAPLKVHAPPSSASVHSTKQAAHDSQNQKNLILLQGNMRCKCTLWPHALCDCGSPSGAPKGSQHQAKRTAGR